MTIAIEAKVDGKEKLKSQLDTHGVKYIMVEPKKLIGVSEVVQFLMDIAPDALSIFVSILELRKMSNEPTTIIIDGIKYEYTSEEQLKAILDSHKKQE
ncbi:MAG: hypothetical protein AAFY36_05340 [Bacteroidota bacterium]